MQLIALVVSGFVSYYGPGFHGKTTASGVVFNKHAMVCAHKSLPFGTKLKVINKYNKSITVTVVDRGPFVGNRILDLSEGAFKLLFPLSSGIGRATVLRM